MRLVETLRDRGHQVLVRHTLLPDRAAFVGERPDMFHDVSDRREFADFDPDIVVAEAGLSQPPDSSWRLPEDLAVEYVNNGGVILAIDLGLGQLQEAYARTQLRFFGAVIQPESDRVPYLDDPSHSAASTRWLLVPPAEMAVSEWLKPAFVGVESIQARSAVPIGVVGHIAASAPWTAQTLVDDQYVREGPAPFASVREIGLGYAAVVTAQVGVDEIVAETPDNAIWLSNLAELLVEQATRRTRLVGSTSDGPEHERTTTVSGLLERGESGTTEFKSTFQFDTRTHELNPKLRHAVTKTVCGFLNSHKGGTLLIGVNDDGAVLGLKDDFSVLGKHQNSDGFERRLRDHLRNNLSSGTAGLVEIGFETTDDGAVCRVAVRPSDEPVFASPSERGEPASDFWVRDGNATRKLVGPDMERYRGTRWSS